MDVSQQSLLNRYLDVYKKNKNSKVFAPLADIYRKLGMIEESIKILKEGLRYNPQYVLGHLNLARCYIELDKLKLAYDTLKPFVDKNAENIALQKIFADLCLKLNKNEEAIFYFEYLSFLFPRDVFFKQKIFEIKQLEKQSHSKDENIKIEESASPASEEEEIESWEAYQPHQTSNGVALSSFDESKEKQQVEMKKMRFKTFLKKIQDKTVSS